MRKERINEIWGVLFLLLGLFALASLIFFHREDYSFYTSHPSVPVMNYTGIIGAYLAFGLKVTFGVSAYLIPMLFLLWAGCFFMQRVPEKKMFKFVGLGIALLAASTLVAISLNADARLEQGGAVGYLAGTYLLRYFGHLGSYIFAGACLLLSLLLATDFLIYPLFKKTVAHLGLQSSSWAEALSGFRDWVLQYFEKIEDRQTSANPKAKPGKLLKPAVVKPAPFDETPIKVRKYQPEVIFPAEEKSVKGKKQADDNGAAEIKRESAPKAPLKKEKSDEAVAETNGTEPRFDGVVGSQAARKTPYTLPSVDLLKRPVAGVLKEDNLHENSKILETTLAEFGIEVKVTEVEQGPVITRYELLPAPGVKVSSISSLENDLAMALKATSIRLIIPIPGKSAIGIEVPNSVTSNVLLRELVESQAFRSRKMTLPLALGKDTSGKPLITDLTGMPHLLIAGTTGSGKTVCVNSIIAGFLYYCTPDELKFVMVDPKMVELAVYNKIPHMLSPVVTDVRKAYQTLNWVVNEMENRYKLLATVGVRNIQGFNSRELSEEARTELENAEASDNIVPAKLPYIVVVIDELADLMMVAQDKVESAITRLAQLARAVGIHLILATQRPSVDVITGVIKANFPARISFKVASKVDSRTVLDGIGADQLIGKGDMLIMRPGDPKPIRGQAAMVSDGEIQDIVKYVSTQAEPEYHPEIQQVQDGKRDSGGTAGEKDELYDDAVRIVLETRQASTSNLQRRMRLGYTRAARIIDQMEAEGLIGPAQGAKPRSILFDQQSVEVSSGE